MNVAAQKQAEAARWAAMHINAGRMAEFHTAAAGLIANKAHYQRIEAHLVSVGMGVPWWFIAIVDKREGGGGCRTQLGQGDPLGEVSRHDPKDRGPFFGADAFDRSCYDALIDCGPYAAKWLDWTVGGVLTIFEFYNGEGYWDRGLPSPYNWSGSNEYVKGKFVADHVFDPNFVDQQLGCAPLLATMMTLDPSIKFAAAPGKWVASPSIIPGPAPGPVVNAPPAPVTPAAPSAPTSGGPATSRETRYSFWKNVGDEVKALWDAEQKK